MGILSWILFGLIAGSVANYIAPSSQGGFVASVVLGIIGAVVGGFLGQKFFGEGVTGFNLKSLTVAVLGALFVLLIGRVISQN